MMRRRCGGDAAEMRRTRPGCSRQWRRWRRAMACCTTPHTAPEATPPPPRRRPCHQLPWPHRRRRRRRRRRLHPRRLHSRRRRRAYLAFPCALLQTAPRAATPGRGPPHQHHRQHQLRPPPRRARRLPPPPPPALRRPGPLPRRRHRRRRHRRSCLRASGAPREPAAAPTTSTATAAAAAAAGARRATARGAADYLGRSRRCDTCTWCSEAPGGGHHVEGEWKGSGRGGEGAHLGRWPRRAAEAAASLRADEAAPLQGLQERPEPWEPPGGPMGRCVLRGAGRGVSKRLERLGLGVGHVQRAKGRCPDKKTAPRGARSDSQEDQALPC